MVEQTTLAANNRSTLSNIPLTVKSPVVKLLWLVSCSVLCCTVFIGNCNNSTNEIPGWPQETIEVVLRQIPNRIHTHCMQYSVTHTHTDVLYMMSFHSLLMPCISPPQCLHIGVVYSTCTPSPTREGIASKTSQGHRWAGLPGLLDLPSALVWTESTIRSSHERPYPYKCQFISRANRHVANLCMHMCMVPHITCVHTVAGPLSCMFCQLPMLRACVNGPCNMNWSCTYIARGLMHMEYMIDSWRWIQAYTYWYTCRLRCDRLMIDCMHTVYV